MTNIFKPKIPKQETPAPPPAPPTDEPKKLEQAESAARTAHKNRRKGRSALRIDLQAGTAGAGGTGINVPHK